MNKDFVAHNIQIVREDILSSASPKAQLLAVTKYSERETILEAYQAGIRDFGENKVQDLKRKALELQKKDIRWHFIGHLQTNKVKDLFAIPGLCAIHSVGSLKLLKELLKHQDRLSHNVGVYFQIKLSNEGEKQGFTHAQEVKEAIALLREQSKLLQLEGLMGMGPIRTDHFAADARKCFTQLVSIRDQLSRELGLSLKLNMGMSQDYKIALELGTDIIRLGSTVFKSGLA